MISKRRIRIIKALFATIIALVTTIAHADQTSLWKITKGGQHIFLGATVHALSESDYPLPTQFDKAYDQAATVVFESDRGLNLTRQGRNYLLHKARIRDGTTLKDHLRPATWRALEAFTDKHQVPIESIHRYKPGMLMVMLTMVQKQSLEPVADGVDAHYLERAFQDGKPVGNLETLVEQIRFFSSLGQDDPDSVVLHAIDEAELEQQSLTDWASAWRRGDLAWIENNPMTIIKTYPAIYESVLVGRNRAWLPQIESLFDSDDVELVLVGSFHLVGKDSLLAMLRDKGYVVQKL
ncbi:MAG: TraB/GumN family protein [Burkholderiaceae bacterium]